jgi:hypothetical protein
MTSAGPASTPPASLSPEHLVLALLYAPDGKKDNGEWRWAAPIEGKTRLVKEIFLVQKESRSGSNGLVGLKFTPGPYGPSSLDLTRTLDSMLASGRIGSESINSGRGLRLRLTPSGGKQAMEVWKKLPPTARSDFYQTKARIGVMTYRQFLVYVYRTYPEFTEKSLIRDELLSDSFE